MKGPRAVSRLAWAAAAAAGLGLVFLGLGQTFYLGTVSNAFERDRAGSALILSGSVLGLAAAGWSLLASDEQRALLVHANTRMYR